MRPMRTAKFLPALATGAMVAVSACAPAVVTDGQTFTGFVAKPTTVMVGQFEFASEIVIQDRALTIRLEREMKGKSATAIKDEAAQRVGNVIAETAIAGLRDAGLKASPGSVDIALGDEPTLVVTGSVRGPEAVKPETGKPDKSRNAGRRSVGFGGAKSQVVADVQLTHLSWGGRKNVLNFTTAAVTGEKPGADEKFPPRAAGEKLSPDVERAAQRIGKDIAGKVIAFAAKQGWIIAPGAVSEAEVKPRT